jgi:hypothetical protein
MVIVPGAHGWLWLKQALTLLAKAPFAWMLVSMAYWVLMAVLARLPYVGLAAGSLVMPALAVSFMAMCRELERGRPLQPALFAAGFRSNLPALVTIGGLYLVATLAIFAATWLMDDGALARWMVLGKPPPAQAGDDRGMLWAVVTAFMLWVPMQLAFWFAPILAAWHDLPAAKALFFSFFAALRNWRAFVVYALVGAAAVVLVAALLFSLHRLQEGPAIVPTVVFLFLVAAVPVYYASLYASYRDVFPAAAPET